MVDPESGQLTIKFNGEGGTNDYELSGSSKNYWTIGLNQPGLKEALYNVADEPGKGTVYVTFHTDGKRETTKLVPRSKTTMQVCAKGDGTGRSFCEYRKCYYNPVACF